MRAWIGLLVCATAAWAAPYDSIVARNAFGLRAPPPVPSTPPQTVWTPPPDLKITGIVTVPPTKKVSFYVIEHGKPPKSYVLAEGEEQDDIKVATIDGDAQTVRVKNQGVYVILDFKTHAWNSGSGAMAANTPTSP